MAWVVLISGIWLVVSSLAVSTKNFASALFFKVIPFFCGVGCILSGLSMLNIISFP